MHIARAQSPGHLQSTDQSVSEREQDRLQILDKKAVLGSGEQVEILETLKGPPNGGFGRFATHFPEKEGVSRLRLFSVA